MKKLTSKEKIRRMSTVAIIALIVYLLLPAKDFIKGFIGGWNSIENLPHTSQSSSVMLLDSLSILTTFVIVIAIIVITFRLLGNIKKDESPFTEDNSRRIRNIGLLVIALEPVQLIFNIISNIINEDIYSTYVSIGGTTFAIGIVLYCISLVFRYGCELQQESDETI